LAKTVVKDGQSMDDIIRTFNSDVRKSGTLKEIKKRKYYDKPGIKKRNKIKENNRNKAKFR